jgi:hypothetical protein
MDDSRAERVVEGLQGFLQGFLLQVEISGITVKLTNQTPSSTSLMPSFWPASTTEMLIFLRCRQGGRRRS